MVDSTKDFISTLADGKYWFEAETGFKFPGRVADGELQVPAMIAEVMLENCRGKKIVAAVLQ